MKGFLITFIVTAAWARAEEAGDLSRRFHSAPPAAFSVLDTSGNRKKDELKDLKANLSPELLKEYPRIAEWALSKDAGEVMQAIRIRDSYTVSGSDKKAFLLPVGRHLLKNSEWFQEERLSGRLEAQSFLCSAIRQHPYAFKNDAAKKLLRSWLKDPHSSARGEAFLALQAIPYLFHEDAGAMLEDEHPNNVGYAIEFLTKHPNGNLYANKIEKIALEFNDIRMPTRALAAQYWITVFPKEKRSVSILTQVASTPAYSRFYTDQASILALQNLKDWKAPEYIFAQDAYDKKRREFERMRKKLDEEPEED